MDLIEIKQAIANDLKVFWGNTSYQVIKDNKDQYLIKHAGGNCIGLTWADNETLNGKQTDFFIGV